MSNRQINETTVVIHARALKTLGLKTALIMLEVAKDLRSGAIESSLYKQDRFGAGPTSLSLSDCNTPCCIWGHVCFRMNINVWKDRYNSAIKLEMSDRALAALFSCSAGLDFYNRKEPSPQRAAQAIENYVLHGHDLPWCNT